MTERTVTVVNRKGLHARCASQLVELAKRFSARVTIHKGQQNANGKSIIGLMLMEAVPGTELLVRAEGPDEEDAVEAIDQLFASGFGEMDEGS